MIDKNIQILEDKEVEKIGKKHPFGFVILVLDKNPIIASIQIKRHSDCEKKLFVDSKGNKRMLVLFTKKHVLNKINYYKQKIEELEKILLY